MKWCEDSIWVTSTRVLAGLACCRLFIACCRLFVAGMTSNDGNSVGKLLIDVWAFLVHRNTSTKT